MKAMILAAGRGERMKPLTDSLPKPLLKVANKSLIEHHIEKLAAAGISNIVINIAWLAEKVQELLGDGTKYGVKITYSHEKQGALETAGGIATAMPYLEDEEAFLVVNGDVYTDFDFSSLPNLNSNAQALLWLVDNPEHNPSGDFSINDEQVLVNKGVLENLGSFTYSGIALFRPSFFKDCLANVPKALGPLLRDGAKQGTISAIKLNDVWTDVGTPQRLADLNQYLIERGM